MRQRIATIHRTMDFNFAHRLAGDPGPCRNLHGHEAQVVVDLMAPVNSDGMVMSFATLKMHMQAQIHDLLDHMTVLHVQDPFLDTLVDRMNLGNDGVRQLLGAATDRINEQGYWDSRQLIKNPWLNNMHTLLIAETPTSENLAYLIWCLLARQMQDGLVASLRVRFQETKKCAATYFDKFDPDTQIELPQTIAPTI